MHHDTPHSETAFSEYPVGFLRTLGMIFLSWLLYRVLFIGVPIFIEEAFVKLIFFGLPVWIFMILSRSEAIYESLQPQKLKSGLFWGLVYGGALSLVGSFAVISQRSDVVIAPLLITPTFWWLFLLAVITGFWESLFFFGWVYSTVEENFKRWSVLKSFLFVAGVFVLFHLPNLVSQFSPAWGLPFVNYLVAQMLLMGVFALGQLSLFYYHRNLYILTLTHAVWGMVYLLF